MYPRGNAGGPIGTCYQSGTGTPLPNCNAPLGPGQSVDVQIDGTSAVPTGAEAATLNLTETNATGPVSFLTLYPAGQMRPNASNINFVGGQTRANRATVQLGAGGWPAETTELSEWNCSDIGS